MDYIIEFDYNADESDELSIRKGDIVNNVKFHEDGWMFGTLRGKEGVFPSNFGKPLKDERKKSQEDITSPNVEDNKPVGTTEAGDDTTEHTPLQKKVTGVGFGNIFSGGKIMLKPTNNKDKTSKTVVEEVKLETSLEKKSNVKQKVQLVKVVHNYKAENPDELNLEDGEIITVLNKEDEDDGWWKGQKANGQIGVFPDNFVEIIKNPSEEELKLARPNVPLIPKGAPPPVTAAKPKIAPSGKNTPPRPPQISKSTSSVDKSDKVDGGVSFDVVLNHKPLVGPTADRAKRPGKKLPSSTNILATSGTKSEEEISVTPKRNSKGDLQNTDSHETIILKPVEKSEKLENVHENSISKKNFRESGSGIHKSVSVYGKENSKPSTTVDVEKPSENLSSKPINKSSTLPKNVNLELDDVSKSTDVSSKKHEALELRVTELESCNEDLRKEINDFKKSMNAQISLLQKKVDNLVKELDDEKSKRATMEVNITRLKTTVGDLETLSLSNTK